MGKILFSDNNRITVDKDWICQYSQDICIVMDTVPIYQGSLKDYDPVIPVITADPDQNRVELYLKIHDRNFFVEDLYYFRDSLIPDMENETETEKEIREESFDRDRVETLLKGFYNRIEDYII